eukprot:TRINITY_DN34449_c0_g1_i1.p1 TRINITY_DN34449_c0_g1~~TRINITY_DN34449_c0_g1_i1.p1  ORF type:complete len:334 (-),score=56.12 TRINITY_DN34449_c0_g1_i1:1270-2241(-)
MAAGLGNTSCSPAYDGPKCSVCAHEYFRSGGSCVKCLKKELRWTIIFVSGVLIVFSMAKLAQSSKLIPPTIRLTLFWYQFLAIYPSLSSNWPSFLFNFLNFASVFNLDIGYLGVQCETGPDSYFWVLTVEILLPIIFSLILLVHSIALKLRRKLSRIPFLRLVSQTIFIMNFSSLQLLSSMFQIFNCVDGGNGSLVVRQEPSVQCGSQSWKLFVIFDSAMMLFYLVYVPVWVGLRFVKATKLNDQLTLSVLIAPLCQSYRSGAEFFELYRLGFRFGFVLIKDTFPISTDSKILFLTFLLLAQIWLESDIRPHADRSHQGLALM